MDGKHSAGQDVPSPCGKLDFAMDSDTGVLICVYALDVLSPLTIEKSCPDKILEVCLTAFAMELITVRERRCEMLEDLLSGKMASQVTLMRACHEGASDR